MFILAVYKRKSLEINNDFYDGMSDEVVTKITNMVDNMNNDPSYTQEKMYAENSSGWVKARSAEENFGWSSNHMNHGNIEITINNFNLIFQI